MEYAVWILIIVAWLSISGELSSIKKKLENKPKTRWNFKELVGKNIKVSLDDEYDMNLEGELISFDNKWIEIKKVKKYNNNEIYYKRIDRIKSIVVKNS